MEINIFQNSKIPIFLFALGLFILSLNLINILSSRKVTLKERTGNKNNAVFNVLSNLILKGFRKKDSYNKMLDRAQFIYGYFSPTSEKANRDKAEVVIFNTVLINLFIIIVLLFIDVLWVVKLFTIVLIFAFEYIYISTAISKKKGQLKQQFPIIVREFIEGYVLTSNVRASFEYSVKELSPIYQVHVNRLINQLSSVTGSEEAFKYFSKRIDYSMASVFISLVQSAYATKKNVVENLLELQTMLSEETVEEKLRKNKMASAKNTIFLWISVCIIELFAVGYYAKTSTGNYFLTTSLGQMLLMSTICSIIMAIACIKVSESV